MSLEVKAILLVVLVVVVGAMMVTYVKNFLGKSVRGALHVPQGKNRVHADVLDSQPLKPYKYSQVFEVQVSAEERTIKDEISGQSLTSTGALIYKNAPIGFIDPTTSHAIALAKLADKHGKVFVSAVILGTDDAGRPNVLLELPGAGWFKRALSAKVEKE